MAKTIWKFSIEVTDKQTVTMPLGSRILHVAEQAGTVCLWAEVDPVASKHDRIIRVFGTGHPMPDDPGQFVGTFMLHDGALVFHVYAM